MTATVCAPCPPTSVVVVPSTKASAAADIPDPSPAEARKRRREILSSQRNGVGAPATGEGTGIAIKTTAATVASVDATPAAVVAPVAAPALPRGVPAAAVVEPLPARKRRRLSSTSSESSSAGATSSDESASSPSPAAKAAPLLHASATAPPKQSPPAAVTVGSASAGAAADSATVAKAGKQGGGTQKKPQMKYDPDVPMTKEEAAVWRREQRRKRNRESAAASRQRQRDRIAELEVEVGDWKRKYDDLMEQIRRLEEATGTEDSETATPARRAAPGASAPASACAASHAASPSVPVTKPVAAASAPSMPHATESVAAAAAAMAAAAVPAPAHPIPAASVVPADPVKSLANEVRPKTPEPQDASKTDSSMSQHHVSPTSSTEELLIDIPAVTMQGPSSTVHHEVVTEGEDEEEDEHELQPSKMMPRPAVKITGAVPSVCPSIRLPDQHDECQDAVATSLPMPTPEPCRSIPPPSAVMTARVISAVPSEAVAVAPVPSAPQHLHITEAVDEAVDDPDPLPVVGPEAIVAHVLDPIDTNLFLSPEEEISAVLPASNDETELGEFLLDAVNWL